MHNFATSANRGWGAKVKALADKSAKNAIFFTCSLRGPCYLHFLKNQKIKGEKNRHLYKIYVLVNFGEIKKYLGLYKHKKSIFCQQGGRDPDGRHGDTPLQAETFHLRLQVYIWGYAPSSRHLPS